MTIIEILKYFLHVGATTFGGPLAICHRIHDDLVKDKKWITQEEYEKFLGYSQIAPGPLAFQLCLYIGFFKSGFWGAVIAGLALMLPSYFLVLIFSIFYNEYRNIDLIKYALYGVGPLLIAIIIHSGVNLSKSILKKDYFLYLIFILSIVAKILFDIQIIYVILISGLLAILYYYLKENSATKKINGIFLFVTSLSWSYFFNQVSLFFLVIKEYLHSKFLELSFVFLKAGSLTYGSGFVIVGVLRNDVVEKYGWLTSKEFIDGIIFGQITPGPVVITSTFIGYLTGGFWGSIISTLCIFLPTFCYVLILHHSIGKIKNNFFLNSFIKGANASAIGAIIAISYILAKDAIIDTSTLMVFIFSIFVLFTMKIKIYYLIFIAACLGILIKLFLFV